MTFHKQQGGITFLLIISQKTSFFPIPKTGTFDSLYPSFCKLQLLRRILVLDNYDSFTYNLVHLIEKMVPEKVTVWLNDKITLEAINDFDKILLSPGPGLPKEAGLMPSLIDAYAHRKSILGICLGHQAIGEFFGAKLVNLEHVFHGIATPISFTQLQQSRTSLFKGLPDTIEVGRYHSWVLSDEDLPACLEVTARDKNGFIMALQHRTLDVQGVQFHPESVLTPMGENILRNWLAQ